MMLWDDDEEEDDDVGDVGGNVDDEAVAVVMRDVGRKRPDKVVNAVREEKDDRTA